MFILMNAYFVLVVITFISSLGSTSIGVALSGLLAPFICCFGGCGMKGSWYGSPEQRVAGTILGIIFLAGGALWLYATGFRVGLFQVDIQGPIWGLIGFFICLLCTTRKDAVVD